MANTELENIEKVQKHLSAIKKRCAEEIKRWGDAKDAEKLNAWYAFDAAIRTAHASGTKDLLSLFPEHSGVVTRGGGGGR